MYPADIQMREGKNFFSMPPLAERNKIYDSTGLRLDPIKIPPSAEEKAISAAKKSISKVCGKYGLDPVELKKEVKIPHENVVDLIHLAIEKLEDLYQKIPPEVLEVAWVVKDIITGLKDFVSYSKEVVLPILDAVRNTTRALGELIENSDFAKAMPKTKIYAILSAPTALYNLAMNIKKFAVAVFHNRIKKAALKGLALLSNVADITGAGATFTEGLAAFGAIKSRVADVVSTNLGIISLFFSIAEVILESRQLKHSIEFEKQMKGVEEKKGFAGVVNFIDRQKDGNLVKRLGVAEGGLLKAQLKDIAKKKDSKSHKTAMDALKKRIVTDKLCRTMKITAAIVAIIACTILLFCSPLAPLGYGLLALTAAVGICVLVLNLVATIRLKKTIANLLPPDSPEVQKYLEKVRMDRWRNRESRLMRYQVKDILVKELPPWHKPKGPSVSWKKPESWVNIMPDPA